MQSSTEVLYRAEHTPVSHQYATDAKESGTATAGVAALGLVLSPWHVPKAIAAG